MMMPERLADRRIPAGDDFLSRDEIDAITPEGLIARMQALKPDPEPTNTED